MSIWLKVAAYSLGGAILGSMIIGVLFQGTGSTNNFSTEAFGVPGSYGYSNGSGYANAYQLPQGGYVSGIKTETSSNRGSCMTRR